MKDLIERQAAIELIHSLYPSSPIMRRNRERWEKKYKPYIEAEKALERLPSAQPEIIYCGECAKMKVDTVFHDCWCGETGKKVWVNHYCGYAERGTDEDD